MPTYWLADNGNDSNDGTSYALAKATLSAAMALLSQGDTLNVVGDFAMPTAAVSIDGDLGLRGTSYSDPAFIIQGTDSSGNPAMSNWTSDSGTGIYFLTLRDRVDYAIIRGIHADYTLKTNNSNLNFINITGTGQSPTRIEYCKLTGASGISGLYAPCFIRGSTSYAVAQAVDPSIITVRYSYFYNARIAAGDNSYVVRAENCVARCIAETNYSSFPILLRQETNTSMRYLGVEAVRCTFDITLDATDVRPDSAILAYCNDAIVGSTNDTSRAIYNNAICVESLVPTASGLIWYQNGLIGNGTSGTTITWSGTMGYNAFVFDTNITNQLNNSTQATKAIYEDAFNPDAPSTIVGTNIYGTDYLLNNATLGAQINNATSSWTWTNINNDGYDIVLPKDYRITNTTMLSMATDGGVVGAITNLLNEAPVVVNHTWTAQPGVTLSVTSGSGVLAGSSDADGDTLTATVVSDVSHGTLVLNTTLGSFSYTPNATFAGTDTFTYKAYDGTTYSNTGTGTLNVVNTGPTGSNKSYSANEGQLLSVPAASGLLAGASDPDGQTLLATNLSTPSNGVISSYNTTTGSFVYAPTLFFTGADSFTFQITDGITNSASYTASIQVSAVTTPSITNVVDTAPFFKPTLRVTTEFRFKGKKNRTKHHDLANYTEKQLWDESTHRVITLTPSTTLNVQMGGVSTAEFLIVETDTAIEVSINDATRYWPVNKVVALALTEVTDLYIRNTQSATSAQVILGLVD